MATQPEWEATTRSEIDRYAAVLLEQGYVIIRGAEDPTVVSALDADFAERFSRTPFSCGNFFGNRTVRFARALIRSRHSSTLVQNPLVLGVAEQVLLPWCESVQLNLTQAIAVHPGAPTQLPHRDQDMWDGPKGDVEYMVNVIWPLTRFSRANGATLVWTGSHIEERDKYILDEGVIAAEMEIGDALLFLGKTLHAQGANTTSEIRRALAIGYSLSWLKPYENQMLSYPPHIARHFPRELAELVGYRQVPPNLNNYEGQSPMRLLEDEVPEYFGAVDAFRPEQVDRLLFRAPQAAPRLAVAAR